MQLDRQCEKFMGGPEIAYAERVHVTIGQKGAIFLNQKAHGMMGRPSAVYLYFNRQKDLVILEPTDALTANNAFQVRQSKPASTGRMIYAKPFCKHFGIRLTTTEKFINPETDATGRLYLKLYETITVDRGPRVRKVNS